MTTGYYLLDHPNPNAPVRDNGLRGFYYTTRLNPIQGIVVHTPAHQFDGIGADPTAENVANYFATGSNPDHPASAHACIDADSTVPCLPDDFTAFHAAGVNSRTLGFEHGWGPGDWQKDPDRTEAVLRRTAQWCAPRVVAYEIPLRFVFTKTDWDAGAKGFLAHSVTEIWRGYPTRRSDPGGNPGYPADTKYPWDQLFGYIGELLMDGHDSIAELRETHSQGYPGGTDPAKDAAWAIRNWNTYVDAGGSSNPDSGDWPAFRYDIGTFYVTFHAPLLAKFAALERRVAELEANGSSGGLEFGTTVKLAKP